MAVENSSIDWVSKTDVIRYLRCPYAFWLLDRGEITFEETVDDCQRELLAQGDAFHRQIEQQAVAVRLEGGSDGSDLLKELLASELVFYGVPAFENARLGIRGQPDGVDAAGGELLPIEFKSHRDVQRTDELELAFYWLLLEPFRTRKRPAPRGRLILRQNGEPAQVEVPILPKRLTTVRGLIRRVRSARRGGVRVRVCGCHVCRGVRNDVVTRITQQQKDLTMIIGIGRSYAEALERGGIHTWSDLLTAKPERVVEILKANRYRVALHEVARWQRHAQAWREQRPVFFGERPTVAEPFIALDLEYSETLIWLVGACLVENGDEQYFLRWADDAEQEARNLRELTGFLEARPSLPIVTWSGLSAELPRLTQVVPRLRLRRLQHALARRHVDLYQIARQSIRFPTATLGLKQIATYLGVPRLVVDIQDGYQAERLHDAYCSRPGAEHRERIKQLLLDYNRDDLDTLVAATKRLHEISLERPS